MDEKAWRILKLVGAGFLLTLLIIFQPFGYNTSGHRTHVQGVGGSEKIQFRGGMYYAGFFAKTTEYPDVITIQFEDEEDQRKDISYAAGLTKSQFSDGTYADIGFTVKWELPDDEATMIRIHKDYQSERRLAESLADYSKACMNYSTPLLDSERHYSGGKSELDNYFQFQLRNGKYLLDQAEILEKDEHGTVVKRTYENSRRKDASGNFVLTLSDVQNYNIRPNFVEITHVDYEDIVDAKLKEKVEQSTKESISKQKLVTAQQEALTAKVEGDRLLAETRATEEAQKLKEVIQKEKEVRLAELSAEKSRFDAQKIKWEGDAKAAANAALVRAGLSPLEKAQIDKETAIGVAAEFAKMQWPEMMIFGGGNNTPTDPLQALGIESLLNIQRQMADRRKN